MDEQVFEIELADIISSTLKKHRELTISGLGTYSVKHVRQDNRQEKDGRVFMDPPSDVIQFVSEDQG
ncbi:HU family DNA-binding protein [Balneolaceae bacterium ANBcel3]|nr:HU family DNA-binding protein [Balneolaceae bacterium ANBcel3]